MTKIIAIIPVRMGSSRFPGKPLKKINGHEMLKIIYNNVSKNNKLTSTFVATCDEIIRKFCVKNNFNYIMTSKNHTRASDRTAEALIKYEKKFKKKIDIVVMVQGDEPMVDEKMVDMSIEPFLKDKKVNVVNLISKIKDRKTFFDTNAIKVVKDNNNNALYFSRSPIPQNRKKNKFFGYKQVCIIPFKRNFLFKYLKMKETSLEITESIDMLRVLENNYTVKLVEIKKITYPVDTPQDLLKVSKKIKIN